MGGIGCLLRLLPVDKHDAHSVGKFGRMQKPIRSLLLLRSHVGRLSYQIPRAQRRPVHFESIRHSSTMETVKNTLAENFGGSAHTLAPESQQFSLEQVPSLKGKVAVVTGGSEGIGFGCTHTLLAHGIDKVFVVSVSADVADGAVAAIREELGQEVANKITWLECDISDFQKTEETAEKIAHDTDRLDILINNAGRGIMSYELTDYGVDRHVRSSTPSPPLRPMVC